MRRNLVISAILLASFIFLMSSGCSQREYEKKIVIRYAGYAFPKYDEFRAKEARKFERLHPEVTVKYEPIPSQGYWGKILTEIAGGTVQDIFFVDDIVGLSEKGALLDLTPYVERDKEYFSQIYPALMNFHYYKGRIYGIPANANTDVLYYNKKLFDEARLSYPDETWTWDRMLEAAKRLTKRDSRGITTQFGIVNLSWETLMKQNGGEIWTENKAECIINSHQTREVIEFVRDMALKYHVSPTFSEGKEQGAWQIFMGDRCGMFYGGRWYAAMFQPNKNLDWSIAPLPKNKNRISRLSFNSLGVSATTKHPELCYELVKFLIRPEGIRFLVEVGDSIPIRWSEEANEYFLSDPTRPKGENQVYIETMKDTYIRINFYHPRFPFEQQTETIKQEMEKFFLENTTAEETLGEIENKLNELIK